MCQRDTSFALLHAASSRLRDSSTNGAEIVAGKYAFLQFCSQLSNFSILLLPFHLVTLAQLGILLLGLLHLLPEERLGIGPYLGGLSFGELQQGRDQVFGELF
jgi:hypothetical protein